MKLEDLDKVIALREQLLEAHKDLSLIGTSNHIRVEFRERPAGQVGFEIDATEEAESELYRSIWQAGIVWQRREILAIEDTLKSLGVSI